MIISRLYIIGFLLSPSEVSTHFAPNWSLKATGTFVLLFLALNFSAPVLKLEEFLRWCMRAPVRKQVQNYVKWKTLRFELSRRQLYRNKPVVVK